MEENKTTSLKLLYFVVAIGVFFIWFIFKCMLEPYNRKPINIPSKVNIQKYKGTILIHKQGISHTFRKGDSIWTENYYPGCFSQFQIGDTIK